MDRLSSLCAINVGAAMLEAGAEVSRVENTIERILKAQGKTDIHIFCISSFIVVAADGEVDAVRIRKSKLNLAEIEKMNTLSRAFCAGKSPVFSQTHYPLWIKLPAVLAATGSFCVFFGGNLRDALTAGLIGIVIYFADNRLDGLFAASFTLSLLAGVATLIATRLIRGINADSVMIGTVMLMIPGLTFSNAIRDMMRSDILSGVIELVEAVFTALAIAFGFGAAVAVLS